MVHDIVVGGTRGTGRVLTDLLLQDGHRVSVLSRRPPSDFPASGESYRHWPVDLRDEAAVERTSMALRQAGPPVNSLIFMQRNRGEGDAWQGELAASLTATKNIIDALADCFAESNQSIVILSSVAGHLVAHEQGLAYHVAKAGLEQMVRYYAATLAPRGIRVNAVSPGMVLKSEASEYYAQHPELLKLYQSIIPLGRLATSEEVAHVIQFLCGPKASYLTGQNIVLDGGLSLQWQASLCRLVAQC